MRQEADISPGSTEPKTFANRRERILVCLLCFAAGLHVFIFSAGFPFFSNVDEYLHFDLITQYSHGQFPRGFGRLKQETLDWIVMYASPEFLSTPEQFPNGKFPSPLWKQSGPEIEPEIAATKAAWTAGRLLSGALIPFALAYVYGIAFLLRRTNALAAPIAVAVLAALLLTSEIAINHVVFASEHNWFHR